MPQDSTQSILKSAKRFFSGTVVSRLTGMLRDVLMAFAFGAGESVAAFFVAFRLSNLLRRVLGEGAMQSALIPHLEGLKKDSPKRAALFFRDLNVGLSLLLIGIIVLMMLRD
jgi:putative peptidoglycan lipid II flippase